jgi:hypothetical protein
MPRLRLLCALLFCCSFGIAGCESGATIGSGGSAPRAAASSTPIPYAPPGGNSPSPATPTAAGATPTAVATNPNVPASSLLGGGKIQHVVVVIMENRTVDNLFNGFPGADTVTTAPISTGATVALQPELLESPCDPDHSHTGWETVYDKGKSDGWDQDAASCSAVTDPTGGVAYVGPKYPNLAYVPQTEAQPYWDIALGAELSGPSVHRFRASAKPNRRSQQPHLGLRRARGHDRQRSRRRRRDRRYRVSVHGRSDGRRSYGRSEYPVEVLQQQRRRRYDGL